jgi:hypothetical protein
LFPGNHSPNAPPQESPILNLVRDGKDQLPNPVVRAEALTRWPVVPAKILGRYALQDHRFSGGLGGTVGRTDPVLVESRHPAITNEHQPVRKRVHRALDSQPGRTMAEIRRDLPA